MLFLTILRTMRLFIRKANCILRFRFLKSSFIDVLHKKMLEILQKWNLDKLKRRKNLQSSTYTHTLLLKESRPRARMIFTNMTMGLWPTDSVCVGGGGGGEGGSLDSCVAVHMTRLNISSWWRRGEEGDGN